MIDVMRTVHSAGFLTALLVGLFAFIGVQVATAQGLGTSLVLATWVGFETYRPIAVEILSANFRFGFAAVTGPGGRSTVIILAIALLLATGRSSYSWVVGAAALGSMIPALVASIAIHMQVKHAQAHTVYDTVKKTFAEARSLWHFSVSGVATLLIGAGDVLVVRLLSSDGSVVAPYAVAVALAGAVGLVMTAVNIAIQPLIADLSAMDSGRTLATTTRLLSTGATIAASLVLAFALVLSQSLLPLITEGDYGDTPTLLLILGLGQLVGVACGPCGTIMLITGHEAAVSRTITIFAVTAITLEVALWILTESLVLVAVVSSSVVAAHNIALAWQIRQRALTTICFTSPRKARAAFRSFRDERRTVAAGA